MERQMEWKALDCFYFYKKHHGIHLECFDSLGLKLETYNLPLQYAVTQQNYKKIQGDDSEKCGEFVLWFVIAKMRGMDTKTFISQFSSNFKGSDVKAERFVSR